MFEDVHTGVDCLYGTRTCSMDVFGLALFSEVVKFTVDDYDNFQASFADVLTDSLQGLN